MVTREPAKIKFLPWLLVSGGLAGLVAAFVITLDKLKLLEDPSYVPACSINPVISCGSVMKTAQAAVFGFPNSWLGLIGFTSVMVVGISLLAGATFKPWYWRLFNIGTLLGLVFVHWLFGQSVYVIHALCPWCMVVWVVTIAVFWFTSLSNFKTGVWLTPKVLERPLRFIFDYKFLIILCWYVVLAALILHHFWYYFRTLI